MIEKEKKKNKTKEKKKKITLTNLCKLARGNTVLIFDKLISPKKVFNVKICTRIGLKSFLMCFTLEC